MSLEVKEFFDPDTSTFTYVVSDSETNEAAIIDPVLNYDQYSGVVSYKSADSLIEYADVNKLSVTWILETHIHADHLTAAKYLKQKFGAKLGVGSKIIEVLKYWVPFFNMRDDVLNATQFDYLFENDAVFNVGNLEVKVMHTPGHTQACVSYLIQDAVFVGDTIFMPDVGTARADFPGGDPAILYSSIKKILSLPDNTRIYVCHDYAPKSRNVECVSSVLEQNKQNIMINHNITFEEYIDKRSTRDTGLSVPKLLYPSLQVNIRAGDLGDPESNGKQFIKVPIKIS